MKKLLLLLTLTTTFLLSASFDCQKAKTDIEKLICSDEELSRLDDELNTAYKNALSMAKTSKDKKYLKQRQLNWLEFRNSKQALYLSLRESYYSRIFFLQPDNGFNIIYSEDNKTCNQFANLLNNDLKKYNEINLSKHKEFNWVEWKIMQKEGHYNNTFLYNIFVSYFDINNDGNEEGVFWRELSYNYEQMPDIKYATKEDGKLIENSTIAERLSGHGYFLNKEINKADINNGFGVYHFTALSQNILQSNPINDIYTAYMLRGSGAFVNPEPYPFKINNTYFIAIFGTTEKIYVPDYKNGLYTRHNNGNIVALAKYNPDNTKSDVCILTRANPNTEKYLRYK